MATAFLFQSYVAQTHIHVVSPSSAASSIGANSASAPTTAKTDQGLPRGGDLPANDDPAKCPLCQAVGHAGQFVWPTAAFFILPQLATAIVPVTAAIVRAPVPDSHNWQGRAPPRF